MRYNDRSNTQMTNASSEDKDNSIGWLNIKYQLLYLLGHY